MPKGVPKGQWAPQIKKGEALAQKHGAFSDRVVDPVARELVGVVLTQVSYLSDPSYEPAVWAWARHEARVLVLTKWLDENGTLDENGVPRPALTALKDFDVALDPSTIEALRGHRGRQLLERALMADAYDDRDLVFCREDGTSLHPDGFSDAFWRHAKAAGLPRIRFHDLRHTHATLALAAGVHPKVVSERLGHASITITLDTYSHAIPAMQETAASLVASLVFDAEH